MKAPRERSWAKESARDQGESAFTPILRRLLHRARGVLVAVFVDGEGECVDYCSSLPPFESKVAGAQMLVTMSELADRMRSIGAGESYSLTVHCSARDFVVRRINEDYLLVVGLKRGALTQRLRGGIEQTVSELRREAEIDVPRWEPALDSVRVEVRAAVGWPYAPAAFFGHDGERREIDSVLGRWFQGARSRMCFRVRTVDGQELTLVHDRTRDVWERG